MLRIVAAQAFHTRTRVVVEPQIHVFAPSQHVQDLHEESRDKYEGTE